MFQNQIYPANVLQLCCDCRMNILRLSFEFSYSTVLDVFIVGVLFDCKATSTDTAHCGDMPALTTNDFHHHLTTTGSDEHKNVIKPCQSQQPDTTTGNWCRISAIYDDNLNASNIETTVSVRGYITTTTTTPTETAPLLVAPTNQSKSNISNQWGGG